MPSQSKYENQKVSRKHLSPLMKCILFNSDGGIQRGEIVERVYGLERRYSGYYTDSCLRGKQKSHYARQYRRAQPAISKALRRLEERGLVRLIRRGRYVKEIRLTEKGSILTQILNKDGSGNQSQ
jgi:DNA-binding transcriptional ArsR family regulator